MGMFIITREKDLQALGHSQEAYSFHYYNSHIFFNMAQKCSIWDKICQKNTMGTFLRYLKQALWYLASHW